MARKRGWRSLVPGAAHQTPHQEEAGPQAAHPGTGLPLRVTGGKGGPPRLGQAGLSGLGVHPPPDGPGYGPYVSRDVDGELDQAVGDGHRLVAVAGARLAGRTRTLAEAAQRHVAGSWLVWFAELPDVPLAGLVAEAARLVPGGPAILWLENAPLALLRQLSPDWLAALPAGLRVFATVDSRLLDDKVLTSAAVAVLTTPGAGRMLGPVSETEWERLAATAAYPALASAGHEHPALMGELMTPLAPAAATVTATDAAGPGRAAVLRAAADWQRAAVPQPLTRDIATQLCLAGYGQPPDGGLVTPLPPETVRRAIEDLLAPAPGGGPQWLTEVHYQDTRHHLSPHPLLTAVADGIRQPPGWPVPTALWDYLAAHQALTEPDRLAIGLTACTRQDCLPAARVLGTLPAGAVPAGAVPAGAVPPGIAIMIAMAAQRAGQPAEARRWYKQEIGRGGPYAPGAMYNLAALEDRQGEIEAARTWYAKAAGTGHDQFAAPAMYQRGSLEQSQGQAEEARSWYLRAVATGQPDFAPQAMYGLGVLAGERDDTGAARTWYTKAIDSGQPDAAPQAMINLGILERQAGRDDVAQTWFQKALDSGQPDAAAGALVNLGVSEERAGRIEAASAWFGKALRSGQPRAAARAQEELDRLGQVRDALNQAVTAVAKTAAEVRGPASAAALARAHETVRLAVGLESFVQGIPVSRLSLAVYLLDLYHAADDEAFLLAAAGCVDRIEPERAALPAVALPRYLALRGDIRLAQWDALYAGYPDAEVRGMPVLDDAFSSLTEAVQVITGRGPDGGPPAGGPVPGDPGSGASSPLYLDVLATLGSVGLAQRHRLKVAPDLEPYANLLRDALDAGAGDPGSRAQAGWTLGRILWETYAETGEPGVLLEAVTTLGRAVAETPAGDRKRLAYELTDATVSAWAAREAGDQPGQRAAELRLRELWTAGTATDPGGLLGSARAWGDLKAREQDWAASAEAFGVAVRAASALLGRRGTAEHQRGFLRRVRGVSVLAAYALAKAGRLAEAVSTLERGRATLAASSAPDSADTSQDIPDDLAPEAIAPTARARLGPAQAVAFILTTWYGGLAIVLRPGQEPARVDLPLLTDAEVQRRLARLMGAYQAERAPANQRVLVWGDEGIEARRPWAPELDAVARWSWDACMGPLLGALPGCEELTLIPVGVLPLVPLHAAWTEDTAGKPGRCYALDRLPISYARSLRAHLAARAGWAGLGAGSVLAVDDPDSSGAPALPGTELEVAALTDLFGRVAVLHGAEATAEAITSRLAGASLLHFGCHGVADLLEPLRSRLLLAGDETLTLAEIARLDLSAVRLCVLSACETAMIGVELPDEVINLPAAFAQAGAATVVGSLWAVPDEATALLLARFYKHVRQNGDPPAQALRRAQRWLRDSTRAEQIAELPPDRRPDENLSPAARRLLGRIRPSQRITDWAALVVSA